MIQTLVVSGYKPHELGISNNKHVGIGYIKKAIERRLIPFIEDGLIWVVISGNLGVELWTGEVVFELKKEYPSLKLAFITPFLNQEEKWAEDKQIYYRDILSKADYVNTVSQQPFVNGWQLGAKNRFILRNSDGLLVLYDDEKEGSPKFILEEAKKLIHIQNSIYYITPYDIQSLIDEESSNEFDETHNEWTE